MTSIFQNMSKLQYDYVLLREWMWRTGIIAVQKDIKNSGKLRIRSGFILLKRIILLCSFSIFIVNGILFIEIPG